MGIHPYSELRNIFFTLVSCLQRELGDCRTVLDLGCGPNSPLLNIKNIMESTGVDSFKPYIEASRLNKIHSKYILADITKVSFKPKSFDAVILIEVLEHLPKKEGVILLKKIESWAKKKIIITSPNGYFEQPIVDNNPQQKHLSGWAIDEMMRMGYKAYGLAGMKILRKSSVSLKDANKKSLLSSIKFSPKIVFFVLSALSQPFVYFFPKYAFEVFYVKRLDN